MKNSIVLSLSLLLLLGSLVACSAPMIQTDGVNASSNGSGNGTATVYFGVKESEARAAYSLANVNYLEISALKDAAAYPEVFRMDYNSSTGVFRSRPMQFTAGLWHFSIRALDYKGTEIYTGKQDITLTAGNETTVKFTLLQTDNDPNNAEPWVLDMAFGRPLKAGEFNTLTGIAFGPNNVLYASDTTNHWIQVYDSVTGTFKESIGKSNDWTFSSAQQIASAPDGSLWEAEYAYIKHAVRGTDGNWIVTSLDISKATTQAIQSAYGIAVAPDGKIFVYGNNQIVVFNADLSVQSTWTTAITGESTNYSGAITVWTDPADSTTYVYFLSQNKNLIRKFKANGTWVADSSTSGSAALNYSPASITSDKLGHIFVSENRYGMSPPPYGKLKAFDKNLNWLADYNNPGSGEGQLDNPTGIAINADGTRLAVADTQNHRYQIFTIAFDAVTGVPSFTPESRQGTAPMGEDYFYSPNDADYDSAGNLYISDQQVGSIKKFDANFAFVKEWNGNYGSSLRIQSVGTQDLLFLFQGDRVSVSSTDGVTLGSIPANQYTASTSSSAPYIPQTFTIDTDGNFLISYSTAQGLYKLQTSLNTQNWTSPISVTPTLAWQKNLTTDLPSMVPCATAPGTGGTYYVLDSSACSVTLLDTNGIKLSSWGVKGNGPGQFNNPVYITTDTTGNVYVIDSGNQRIQKFDPTGKFIEYICDGVITYNVRTITVKGTGEEIIVISNSVPYISRWVKRQPVI